MVFHVSVQISIELWSLASWELARTQGNWSPQLAHLTQKMNFRIEIHMQKLGLGASDLQVRI